MKHGKKTSYYHPVRCSRLAPEKIQPNLSNPQAHHRLIPSGVLCYTTIFSSCCGTSGMWFLHVWELYLLQEDILLSFLCRPNQKYCQNCEKPLWVRLYQLHRCHLYQRYWKQLLISFSKGFIPCWCPLLRTQSNRWSPCPQSRFVWRFSSPFWLRSSFPSTSYIPAWAHPQLTTHCHLCQALGIFREYLVFPL